MALIQCPECKKEVSDEVSACPFCGKPRSQAKIIVTIEQTSKKWKVLTLISILTIVASVFVISEIGPTGLLLTFFGILLHIISRIGAWWNNG